MLEVLCQVAANAEARFLVRGERLAARRDRQVLQGLIHPFARLELHRLNWDERGQRRYGNKERQEPWRGTARRASCPGTRHRARAERVFPTGLSF